MEIRKAKEQGVLVIEPEGRIDTTTAPDFEQAVVGELNEGCRRLLIDFGAVEYISSAGLRILLMLAKRLVGDDEALVLCGLNESVREVFDISGLTSVFTIEPSRQLGTRRLTLPPDAQNRVRKALALWSIKPRAARDGPVTTATYLGYELLTGQCLPPERSPAIEPDVAGAGDPALRSAPSSGAGAEGGAKKLGGWLGRLGKR